MVAHIMVMQNAEQSL